MKLYAEDPSHAHAPLRCLTATEGNKPYTTHVCRAVLSTDVQESLSPGRYWLLVTVDLLPLPPGGNGDVATEDQYVSVGIYHAGSGSRMQQYTASTLPDLKLTAAEAKWYKQRMESREEFDMAVLSQPVCEEVRRCVR